MTEASFTEIQAALVEHGVLVFRDQPKLTPQQQVAFGRRFGPLHTHPAAPTLATLLQLHVLPSCGGDTLFSSMCAAFETLSSPCRIS